MQQSALASLRPFQPADGPSVLGLLDAAGLPRAGVEASSTRLWVAEAEGRVVAAVGLEVHGSYGLLRSLVVEPERRGEGLGSRLAETVLTDAKREGLRALFLLTTTAEGYFPRLGFERVARSDVPTELEASEELRGACPATASVMRKELT